MSRSAFGYVPAEWPPEDWFSQGATPAQIEAVEQSGRWAQRTRQAHGAVCRAILAAYEIDPHAVTKGSCSVLIDFFKNAQPGSVKAAERTVAETMFGQGAMF